MFTQYNNDWEGYGTAFQALATEYQTTHGVDELTATTAILNSIFGDAITLSKAPASSTSFSAVTGINENWNLVIKQCK